MGLFGEGHYNLHSMKEIYVTDSFLGLDRDTRNCQNIESLDDCKTKHHLDVFLPYNMDVDKSSAIFIRDEHVLSLTLPILV